MWTSIVDKTSEDTNRLDFCADAIKTHENKSYESKVSEDFSKMMQALAKQQQKREEEKKPEEESPSRAFRR